MFKFFFPYLKILFYIANIVLITLYVFPGSILGWFLFDNAGLQPQITRDFIVSTNHVYAFTALSILGYISYKNQKHVRAYSARQESIRNEKSNFETESLQSRLQSAPHKPASRHHIVKSEWERVHLLE